MVFDSGLKIALDITRRAGRCFYQLRQLRSIRRSLNTDATKTPVNAFISSRVYYCNSVFNGTGAVHILVQSSLISMIPHTSLSKSGSITRLRQQFEMSCIGYRCNKDLSTNSEISSTDAFIRVHRYIYIISVYSCLRDWGSSSGILILIITKIYNAHIVIDKMKAIVKMNRRRGQFAS